MTRLLFVCIHNAGRSQIAAAFATRLGLEARSAGSDPSAAINPLAAQAMAELDIDLSRARPRKLETTDAEWADIVVTMGCGDACPYIPSKQYIDWQLPDPSGMSLDQIRALRDDIQQRVQQLAALALSPASPGAKS